MSSRSVHIQQARHNAALARELVSNGYRCRDWAIIAAFYAAVHYFEARLHDAPPFTHPAVSVPIRHTETSRPRRSAAGNYSPHHWRQELLENNCAETTVDAYRQLRSLSEAARYHARIRVRTTAHDYFSNAAVDRCLDEFLEMVKAGLGVS